MSWFSVKGIKEEIRKIQWPNKKDMSKDTLTVLAFVFFFAVYFMFTEVIISQVLRMLKVF